MRRSRSIPGIIFATAVVLALSACAPPTTGSTTPPSGSSKPTSTPTPTQAAVPSVRVPVKCSALFADATVSPLIGTAIKYHLDETTTPVNIIDVTARQAGTLVCLWGGQDRTDGGYDQNLTVEITPDATAGFNSNITQIEAQSSSPVTKNSAGDQSEYQCSAQGDLQCSSNMLVGSFWVSAYLQDLGNQVKTPVSVVNGRIQKVLATVATALTGVTALPAWVAPGAGLPAFCSDTGSTAEVNSALGVTDFTVGGVDEGPSDAESFTQTTGDYAQCVWGSNSDDAQGKFTSLSIALLKGGSWAIPALVGQSNPQDPMLGAYSTVTIPGADSAVSSCSTDVPECDIVLSIGNLLVTISTDDPGDAKVYAAVSKLIPDIQGS